MHSVQVVKFPIQSIRSVGCGFGGFVNCVHYNKWQQVGLNERSAMKNGQNK